MTRIEKSILMNPDNTIDLSNNRYKAEPQFPRWLQRHIFPSTISAGELNLDTAVGITDALIDCKKKIEEENKHRKFTILEMAYCANGRFTSPYCPICNPQAVLNDAKIYNQIIPAIYTESSFQLEGAESPYTYDLKELVIAVAHGEEPKFKIYGRNPRKIYSFQIEKQTFDIYTQQEEGQNRGSLESMLERNFENVIFYKKNS